MAPRFGGTRKPLFVRVANLVRRHVVVPPTEVIPCNDLKAIHQTFSRVSRMHCRLTYSLSGIPQADRALKPGWSAKLGERWRARSRRYFALRNSMQTDPEYG
jgi:hypothetical protein